MNLAVNARDAMVDGGTSAIHARRERQAAGTGGDPVDGVLLVLSDTGEGMTEDVKSRVFEPFFTTKPAGVGTGLGLATCLSIVEQANGSIRVESERGKGTHFHVWLPARELPRPTPVNTGARPTRVLVVDDDAAVRRAARRLLEDAGFEVDEAADAASAWKALEAPVVPDVAVVDLFLGADDGLQLARELRTRTSVGLVLVSGYVERPSEAADLLARGATFIHKPYGVEELKAAVLAAVGVRLGATG